MSAAMIWLALAVTALTFTPQKLSVDGRVIWVDTGDFNKDGGPDLVVAFRRGSEPDTKRFLAFFYQQADGKYPERANEERPVPADAAIAAVSDCDGDGASEVVFLTSQGLSGYFAPGGALGQSVTEMVKAPTATQFPEIEDLPVWDLCSDYHKRGREVALWDTGTLAFYKFEGGKWAQIDKLKVPPQAWMDSLASGTFRGAGSNRDLSISASYVFPELTVGDYEGDGKPDLFVIQEDSLRVYGGTADGKYSPTPTVALSFSIRTLEERNRRGANVNGMAVDLNGDKRTDFVLNKVSGGLASMKTETHIHLNKTGFRKQPDQEIRRDGFSALIQFVDLDGDGLPEMIEPSSGVGLTMLARALVSKSMSIDWLFTKNENGTFNTKASTELSITFGLDFSGGPFFKGPFPRFTFDFDNDGLRDFLTSPDGQQLHVYLGKKENFFEGDPALKVKVDVSPFTSPFYDARRKKTHVVSFFRDMPGKENKIQVLLNE